MKYKAAYEEAIIAMQSKLIRISNGRDKLTILGELVMFGNGSRVFLPKMDHLSCFVPGMLALGVMSANMPLWHLTLAIDLMKTCYKV